MTRIALIHALPESISPIHEALAQEWPEARAFDLLDSSLPGDLACAGRVDPTLSRRFMELARYAASAGEERDRTAGILFTCSAFGPAIQAVKAAMSIPVLHPNESAFEQAVSIGGRVGLLVTFPPSLHSLEVQLHEQARLRGVELSIVSRNVEGALDALHGSDFATHDRLIAAAADELPLTDSLILGQFSMARAASSIKPIPSREVLTTPTSAVRGLRALVLESMASPVRTRRP